MEDKVKEWLVELEDVLDKRKGQYEGATISVSLVFGKQGIGISKLEMLFADQEFLDGIKDESKDYGNCRLLRKKLNLAEAEKILKKLKQEEGFDIDGEHIDFTPYSPSSSKMNSSETPQRVGWPCYLFHANLQQSGSTHLNGPLLSADEPLFPYLSSAERAWLLFGEAEGDRQSIQGMGIICPDFRARLGNLEIGADRIKIDIDIRQGKREEILGKWFIEEKQGTVQSDFNLDEDVAILKVESFPDNIHVYLINRGSSEDLDWRSYWSGRDMLEPGISFEVHEGDIDAYLRQGENQYVEFKREFNKKNSQEFHETVSAFANTKGGVIMVGVDDNGAIAGVEDPNIEDRVRDSLNNCIQPMPEIEFETIDLQGMKVLLMQVEVGENPPYMLRGLTYIRSGGTDRRAGRPELDAIYQRKVGKSPYESGWSRY